MADELARLDTELGEVDLLVTQARTEAARHETRRVAGADKVTEALAADPSGASADPAVAADLNAQLVLLTKRAALMESQVEVLEGKRRALGRYREALGLYVDQLAAFGAVPATKAPVAVGGDPSAALSHRPCRVSCSTPRRTSVARSRARCTTDPPRA